MKFLFHRKLFNDIFINTAFIFSIEMIARVILNYEIIDYVTLRLLISSFLISTFLTFIMSFTTKIKIQRKAYTIVMFIISFYAFIQAGFNNFIGSFISLGTSSQAGAVTQYTWTFLDSIPLNYYLIWMPFITYLIFQHFRISNIYQERSFAKLTNRLAIISFNILLVILYILTLEFSFMQNPIQLISNKELIKNPSNSSIAVNQFGLTLYGLLDVKELLLPHKDNISDEIVVIKKDEDTKRKINDDLWKEIIEKENNKDILQLHNYFINRPISDYNEYSGTLEGKNVIFIMMETVGNAFLKEEYFPNFAKILKNSWYFKNNYSPRNTCATADNEFSGITSLYAVSTTCTANTYIDNTYFQSVFNLFKDKGYTATSYHNYNNQFYFRNKYHKNLGSEKYYNADDLGIDLIKYKEPNWPSDVELIEKSYNLFSKDKPFMAWITTVTGHYPYNVSSEFGDKYLSLFENTNYSMEIKRYLSKIKVTDDALGKLLELLEKDDLLDDTVIVLYGDHYPYALDDKLVQELFSYDITEFYEKDRVPFIIYNPRIKGNVFSQKTSYMNLLPTIANLFNLDYDPRLYFGEDLFSKDFSNRIVFPNDSWEDSIARYDSNAGKINYLGQEKYSLEEIKKINYDISLKKKMSTLAIKKDYFSVLEKEKKELLLREDNIEE